MKFLKDTSFHYLEVEVHVPLLFSTSFFSITIIYTFLRKEVETEANLRLSDDKVDR